MEKQSKFLPERVSGALKSLAKRVIGGVILAVGLWAVFALMFHNPYLDGFAAASTFGNQSLMGNIVGFVRFGIGFVPALFLFLCIARWGLVLLCGWGADSTAPEYNFLRGFIAVCLGAAGLGLVAPNATFGGLAGVIVASDVGALIHGWGIIVGILCVAGFLVLGAILLHIKWSHVKQVLRVLWRVVRWLMSVFHLTRGAASATTDEEAEDAADEEADATDEDTTADAEEEEDAPKKKRATKKRASAAVAAGIPPRIAKAGEFQLPPPELLEKSTGTKNVVTPELRRNATSLEAHFEEFGVYGKVMGINPGPIVTLYEFEPDPGMRNAKVTETAKDMTRAMAVKSMRIAPINGTRFLGIEMANVNPNTVRYREIIADPAFVESKYKIPLALGVNIGGKPMYYDLAKMPHMMIAGRTGSGKSVFVQSIITSIVYHFTPDKCKLMIIDPKGVDFGFWDDIPHLITPIVKLEAAPAVNALKWAVREMDERYKQMAVLNARNIESYNEAAAARRASGEKLTRQVAVGTDEETGELLFETQEVDLSDIPYIVIIIDEVADLMTLARKDVEMCVMRIAQKARAAGIHLVMATQRPDATVITGTIKANFPTRISFQARSNIDSRTTLGEGGAENLLSCGDMLFSEGGKPPVRIHGAFISDAELTAIGDFLRAQGTPEYAAGVTDADDSMDAGSVDGGGGAAPAKVDKNADLYAQAKEIVIRDKKPTISYLQRRLGIGYNKAATMIERMEEEGVVSAPDANNKRHIL